MQAPSSSRLRRALAPLAVAVGVVSAPSTSLHAQAQATTGVIRGTVADSAGRALEGATVTLRNRETNDTRSLATNARGAYVASLLRVGTYDVSARLLGYAQAERRGVSLRLGASEEVNFILPRVAVSLDAVTVTSTQPTVDVSSSAEETRLDARAVSGLPNNGRNVLNLTTLAPNVAITQGPDGDVISIGGQRGIHNNVSVDGADFNNPFFGEQRGGQRPAFTFNLDAVQDFVVVSQGANAEFGRSGGGFVNVITKSGTNQLHGTAHYFGKSDALSNDFARGGGNPNFSQNQFGFTLGGPLRRDRAFFFVAYDQQLFDQTKQTQPTRFASAPLRAFVDSAFGGALASDYGPITRTNDAQALLAKIDVRLSAIHSASLKYNFTNSRQENGTFDVDVWGRSANGLEKDYSNAVNGQLTSLFSSALSNEFRFQLSREDRPRPYDGPVNPATGRRFPDTGVGFDGYRFGQPFFLPVEAYDTRVQLLDNVSVVSGNHLYKVGGEWNRTLVKQTFQGFANGRMIFGSEQGFFNYVANGPGYVECSNGSSSLTGSCPAGTTITGPVLLYLQQVGLGGRTAAEAGTQEIVQHELALFAQDSWKATPRLTVNYGLRWEAQIQPDPITPAADVFFAPLVGTRVTNTRGTFEFPSDGKIPSDYKMFQPRLGAAYDVSGDGTQVVRGSAGLYYARVPGLVLASSRSTNGSIGQSLFRNSELTPVLGAPPAYGELLTVPSGGPFRPDVFVFDRDFQNPRTFTTTLAYDRELFAGVAGSISYTYARTDHLTRFVNRNDAVFGSPFATGIDGANGIGTLTVVEATAKSRYSGATVELRRTVDPDLQFQVNYTLSYDKADDDNERDPFSFRYARADRLDREYGYSDRDQRHRVNAWLLAHVPGNIFLNNRVSAYSAQPASEQCGTDNRGTGARAISPQDRICPDGSILQRNTLRKDNAFFSWDIRASRPFTVGASAIEVIAEVFNVTNADNFRDPAATSLLFNFDGTVRSGLGDPRQAQLGVRYVF
ncbi:MAG TPA: carboxypeptidase regulatory-like domain-containing protein [Gemmatimonadaceae bacterium]|nr:carboxypeptidase regulatory-like domain-containing protein [Gemmatimonadaceae bacterium]